MILGNVIVFGSTGDIGSAIVHKIAPISKSLTLVSRQKPDGLLLEYQNAVWVSMDYPVNKKDFLCLFDESKFDVIINAIGVYTLDQSLFDKKNFESNMLSNFEIVRFIAGFVKLKIKKTGWFFNISSIASSHGTVNEFSYSASKELVDRFLSYFGQENKKSFRVINLSPGAVIGRITSEREDSSLLIDPEDLASLLIMLLNLGPSISVPELNIYRNRYSD